MVDISRILCPVDFSDVSRRALDYAVGMARWYGATLTVLHVAPVPIPSTAFAAGTATMLEPAVLSLVEHEKLRADLLAFANAKPAGDVRIEVEVVEGQVWREIRERAAALDAGLVVAGTHGRSGFERLMLGSVTEKLLRVAPCPVLTVPPAASFRVPGAFKTVLCATDFSPAAGVAVRWASALAEEGGAELLLLHVAEEHTIPGDEAWSSAARSEFRQEYDRWCTARLRDAVPDTTRTWCTVRELTARGVAHAEIVRTAAAHRCDVIALGVSGHHSIGDRVFGSTSQHVVRAATCPVLTTR